MKTVFLAFSLALTVTYLSSCGDKKSASIEIIPRAQYIDYDVSEFSRLTTPSPYEKENPFALLVNNQGGEVRSCTSTLLTSGYVLTNAHCIHRLNSNKIVSPDNLYLFFRNLGDEEESVFKIKQVIAQSYKRLDTRKAENEFPALSPAENKADFQRYSLNAFKNEHDWAVLELENPSQALSRFKGIDGFDESTFDYKNFADEVLSGKNMMTFHAIDPYAVVDGDRYKGKFKLRIVEHSLDLFFLKEYRKIFTEAGDDIDLANVKTLEKFKSFPINSNLGRGGNSGSAIIFEGEVIGVLKSNITAEICRNYICTGTDVINLFFNESSDLHEFMIP